MKNILQKSIWMVDNPAIPPDRQQDAPVLKALEQLRSLVRAKDAAATQ